MRFLNTYYFKSISFLIESKNTPLLSPKLIKINHGNDINENKIKPLIIFISLIKLIPLAYPKKYYSKKYK
jgi:hypothetical protein